MARVNLATVIERFPERGQDSGRLRALLKDLYFKEKLEIYL